MRYYIADTETVGLAPPPFPASGVVEVAWLEVDEDLNILQENYHRTNPGCLIADGASKVHGIYDADVRDCPALGEVFQIEESVTIIGHSVAFDMRFLRPFIASSDVHTICTLALARRWITTSTNHKLGTLVEHLKLPQEQAHNALGDVKMTRHLLKHLLDFSRVSLGSCAQAESKAKILHRMPFGKHKNESMLTVPIPYFRWLLAQGDLPHDLSSSIKHYIKLRNT